MYYEIKCSKCGNVFLTNDELAYEVYLEDLGVWCDECIEENN